MNLLEALLLNLIPSALLMLAAWLLRSRPALAHPLLVLALLKLVTPFTAWPEARVVCASYQPPTWPLLVLGVWLSGSLIVAGLAWSRWQRFSRLAHASKPATSQWQEDCRRLAAEIGLKRPPQLRLLPGQLPPMVLPALPRPLLLLPDALLPSLNDAQRESLLLHELAHLRCRDHWVRGLELLAKILYWWLPLWGLFGRMLRDCEEARCDESVVYHRPDGRREYARLLLDVVDFTQPAPCVAMAMTPAKSLEARLLAILHKGHRRPHRWLATIFVLLGSTAFAGFEERRTIATAIRPATVEATDTAPQPAVPEFCCPPPTPACWVAKP